jgi:hypothetical protein
MVLAITGRTTSRHATVRRRGADGRYVRALGAMEGVVEKVPECEGLTLDLSGLWGRADKLAGVAPAPEGTEI